MCYETNTPAPSAKKRGHASNVLSAGAAINDISNHIGPPEKVQCHLMFRVVGFAPNELNKINILTNVKSSIQSLVLTRFIFYVKI